MGREVRRVPKDWQHPILDGKYYPMFDMNFEEVAADWDAEKAKWDRGEFPDYADDEDKLRSYEEWNGERPNPDYYMPAWPDEERTHLQMYETTSEGTPISPVFATPEELARWLADNKASAFASMTATYEKWLAIARGGFAPSMVTDGKRMMSGVEAATELKSDGSARVGPFAVPTKRGGS